MLSWLFPSCPVNAWEKAWTEYRLRWLIEQFGAERLLKTKTVLPTDEFFPDDYDGSPDLALRMMERVCRYMHLDRKVELQVVTDEQYTSIRPPEASDLRPAIRVATSHIEEPEILVYKTARQLTDLVLFGSGLTGEEDDYVLLADLFLDYSGLGVFAANSVMRELDLRAGNFSWWNMQQHGDLPARMHGYALAVVSWLREESWPYWQSHLRLDARSAMTGGLRYLRRTRDCTLQVEDLGQRQNPSHKQLLHQLERGTPSARIVAMWDCQSGSEAAGTKHALLKLLRHKNRHVRAAAAGAVGRLPCSDENVADDVIHLLADGHEDVRIAAVSALGQMQLPAEAVVEPLAAALSDEVSDVVHAAAAALRSYGKDAGAAVKPIVQALHAAMIDCHFSLIDHLLTTLKDASPDPGLAVNEYFSEHDQELREQAIDLLYGGEDTGIMYADDEHAAREES